MPIAKRDNEDKRWQSQHERHIRECHEIKPEVLLIGDGIIQRMQYQSFWGEVMVPLNTANFGIEGDCVQKVLYRIDSGALHRLQPKVIVLHVGTNNVYSSPDEISDGIIAIINALHEKIPEAHIIVWGLLPRGEYSNKLSHKNERTNALVEEKMWGIPNTQFLTTGEHLGLAKGVINSIDMYDYLHLTNVGYRKTFLPVVRIIRRLLASKSESN